MFVDCVAGAVCADDSSMGGMGSEEVARANDARSRQEDEANGADCEDREHEKDLGPLEDCCGG